MHILEIILFASIAAFFLLRLYSVLGKRTGHEPRPEPAPVRAPAEADAGAAAVRPAFTGPAAAGMEAIRRRDGVFDPEQFAAGARAAYEAIVAAFADGDRETLSRLLTEKVNQRYAAALDARESQNQRQVTDIVRIARADIEAAEMAGDDAKVTVRFEAELATAVTDADGAVVDGDLSQIKHVTELWTFTRDVSASDPNWRLAGVRQG